MNKRERILAAAVLLLVALLGGRALLGRYTDAVELRRNQVSAAKSRLSDAERALAQGREAMHQVEAWQARSLPEDREKARSLYKAWLLEKAKDAGLSVEDITPSPRTTPSSAFTSIGYQIEGTGSLSAVAAMLYEFYRSPQLHQITRLRLGRPPGATQMNVTLEVEALSLPGAVATDKLPEGESKRLKLASVAEYQKNLTERDLASVYTPPRPPRPAVARRDPPRPPEFDDASQARLTGIVGSSNGRQAWILVRTTGETLRLSAGDPFKVGSLEGKIVSIDLRSVVFASGDKEFHLKLDQSLRSAMEMQAEGEASKTAPPRS
jgi:hypothetical protein